MDGLPGAEETPAVEVKCEVIGKMDPAIHDENDGSRAVSASFRVLFGFISHMVRYNALFGMLTSTRTVCLAPTGARHTYEREP